MRSHATLGYDLAVTRPQENEQGLDARPIIDVQRIVDDIQVRVARKRTEAGKDQRFTSERRELESGRVVLRPEASYSTKPGVGSFLTFTKRTLIRLNWHFFRDMAEQVNAALELGRTAVDAEAKERVELERRLDDLLQRVARIDADLAEIRARGVAPTAIPSDGPAIEGSAGRSA